LIKAEAKAKAKGWWLSGAEAEAEGWWLRLRLRLRWRDGG